MDREQLLAALSDLLDQLGADLDPEDLLEQLSEYLQQMGRATDPQAILQTAGALLTGQQRMERQRGQAQVDLGWWRLFGRLEPARCAMTRRAGEAPGSFKRAFPRIWSRVRQEVGGRRIAPELLDGAPSRSYRVFEQPWVADERLSPEPALVLILTLPLDDVVPRGLLRAADMIRTSSMQSGHPVADDCGLLTAGWVRVVDADPVLLVEEVQSDWFAAKTQWERMPPAMRRRSPIDYDEMAGLLAGVTEHLEALPEDLLAAAFRFACEEDLPTVEVPGFEARSAVSSAPPPRSPYDRTPRRFGMTTRSGAQAPVLPLLSGCRFWSLTI